MNTIRRTAQSPALRLKWLASLSPPFRRELPSRNYLIGVGLGLMLMALLAIGIAAGILGTDVFARYVQQIIELAWPGNH
jgi:hypothetical protein